MAGSMSAQTLHEGDDILLGGCLPPEEPYQFELPDDPELRQMINEDYQTFILQAEDYMNCLQAEQQRTFKKPTPYCGGILRISVIMRRFSLRSNDKPNISKF